MFYNMLYKSFQQKLFLLTLIPSLALYSQVRVIGVVRSAEEREGGQSVEYKIADDSSSDEQFTVIHYRGVVIFLIY